MPKTRVIILVPFCLGFTGFWKSSNKVHYTSNGIIFNLFNSPLQRAPPRLASVRLPEAVILEGQAIWANENFWDFESSWPYAFHGLGYCGGGSISLWNHWNGTLRKCFLNKNVLLHALIRMIKLLAPIITFVSLYFFYVLITLIRNDSI